MRCRKIEHKLQFIISICRAAAQVSLSEHFCVAFLRSNVRAQNHSFSRHGANHFFSRRAAGINYADNRRSFAMIGTHFLALLQTAVRDGKARKLNPREYKESV